MHLVKKQGCSGSEVDSRLEECGQVISPINVEEAIFSARRVTVSFHPHNIIGYKIRA